ncbi:amidotransferase [Desulfoluna limicola]|uniref:Amidotransferase n=1 Tax=Desulfoluna limicola TaxID=2810562 RepID=A0ABN6F696_9BACT|nr:type 1 glutamine amidotransferase [Desulfoluna limicola]BCS97518.1 amidotransferase [Desulfoluna limicola]
MKVHHLQHVSFEGLGSMETVLKKNGHTLTATHLYRGESLPPLDTIDLLIVMGGPMGVYDDEEYPWLKPEKRFIRSAIDAGKKILGICLGAQLLADALGAKVTRNHHREIGWFPIVRHADMESSQFKEILPAQTHAFHWHGDTFEIPEGAQLLASSMACLNQGFIFNDRIVALQFHLETTPASAALLIENGRHELEDAPFVQTEEAMLSDATRFEVINGLMARVLDALTS